jgi:peroxiredoxin Q/BCP
MAKKKTQKSRKKETARKRPVKSTPKKSVTRQASRSSIYLKEGDIAPDFRLPSGDGREIGLSDYRGRSVVLYFYPKDFTSGCTVEACSFRDGLGEIQKKGGVVLGVSADSASSHEKFGAKHNLNFPLLSDEQKDVVQRYGVWQEKSMYGRSYMGIVRATFIIDEKGYIKKIFPKVNVNEHLDEVLAAL